ncbi:hypothetical protein V8C35DRAFT_133405 [Trichoderma chlorosporum]
MLQRYNVLQALYMHTCIYAQLCTNRGASPKLRSSHLSRFSIPCISRSPPASPSLAAQCYSTEFWSGLLALVEYGVRVLARAVARLGREQLAVHDDGIGRADCQMRCCTERRRGLLLLIQSSNSDPLPCRLIGLISLHYGIKHHRRHHTLTILVDVV